MSLPEDIISIVHGTMSSILESKQYENTGIGKKVAENKIKVEREQQAIKKTRGRSVCRQC